MKKVLALVLVLCLAACLCACGNVTYSSSSTTTTTTTDANGNTTTTSTTTTNAKYPAGSCGEATQDGESHDVSVSIANDTGDEMHGLYICATGATEWSNLFDEDEVLGDGETAEDYVTLTYSNGSTSFDLGIKGSDDELVEFDPVDIANLSADGFTITFTEDGWTAK